KKHTRAWDKKKKNRHAEIGVYERAHILVVAVRGLAKSEVDRHKHQPRAMSNRNGERPKPQLRRRYPRQRPRMTPVDNLKKAEPDDQQTGTDLNLLLPFNTAQQ